MQAFIFVSQKDLTLLAYSSKKDGSNLPPEWGPWTHANPANPASAITPGGSLAGVGAADPVIADLERQGFHLTRGPNREAP